jgi:hypothetical protein
MRRSYEKHEQHDESVRREITITEGGSCLATGRFSDSIENIALLNADNVMTGTNTLLTRRRLFLPRRRVCIQTRAWFLGPCSREFTG